MDGPLFQNFVCWSPEAVGAVMDTEALRVSDGVFAATHHPVQMVRRGLVASDASTSYDQGAFLKEFLDPDRHEPDFRFVPVLGDSGTGKSHLIRWLKTQIEETDSRRVILVPKSGTNLRDIIAMILEGHTGEPFDGYRTKLDSAVNAVSDAEGRRAMLDALASAVQFRSHPAADDSDEALIREEVEKHVPRFLRDIELSETHWLREGGVIARLYTSALGHEEARSRRESELAFTRADLPLALDESLTRIHPSLHDFYRELQSLGEFQDAVVALLNDALDDAVRHLLALSGEDLTRLLRDVRQSLASEGIELVLLFEDFAKLQGIDRPLLEGLLERNGDDGSPPLAPVRTALACTSGYYLRFADTVRTRATFRVDLDVPGAEVDLQEFASRYLNAAREGAASLDDWRIYHADAPAPVACDECPFREPCHETFGAEDGRGLYPFNGVAIEEAYRRTGAAGFNPREFIKGVLRYVLEQHADSLEAGDFPPRSLRVHLSEHARNLDLLSLQTSSQRDPDNHERRRALVEIWSRAPEVVNLDPIIHQAFDLPYLPGADEAVEAHTRVAVAPVSAPQPPPSQTLTRADRTVRQIDAWGNGSSTMDQNLVQNLRDIVFPALVAHTDWNSAGLQKSKVVGQGKLVQNTSVNFERQQPNVPRGRAILQIPVAGQTVEEAAIALTGLVRARTEGWTFPKAGDYMRRTLRALDLWSAHLVDTVRKGSADAAWDPAIAAVELLALGARLHGRPIRSATSPVERLDAAFEPPPPPDDARSEAWSKLTGRFREAHPDLVTLVETHAVAVKGDSSSTLYLDAGRLLPRVSSLARRDWMPAETVPSPTDLPRSNYRPLADLRADLESLLRAAIDAEAARYVEWIDRFERDVDPDWSDKDGEGLRDGLRDTLQGALKAAQDAGESPLDRAEKSALTRAINNLASIRLRPALDATARVREWVADGSISDGKLLGELGADLGGALETVTDLLDLADDALGRTEQALQRALSGLTGGQEAAALRTNIVEGLDALRRTFLHLADADPAATSDGP